MVETGVNMGTSTPPVEEKSSIGEFVHLHLHTEYSLLDGGNQVDRLVARVKELGMKAVGVTDHGNLFGAVAVYLACRDAGIKPILGVEAYVTPPGKDRTDRTYSGGGEGGYHLVLLAENDTGWRNLMILCSEAYLTGFYYKPRIDRELLAAHSAGLIAVNGHLGSEIGDHLLAFERSREERHWEAAVESARWHAATFADTGTGPRFFVEMQHHVSEQNAILPHVVRLARSLGLPLLADNDAHFLRAEDHDAHDTLICISTAKAKSDPARMRYPPELYVKSPSEMRGLCDGEAEEVRQAWAEGCDRTVEVASRCRVDLPLGRNHAPMVRVKRRDGALPGWEDAVFGGDLSRWYAAYCGCFEVVPFERAPTAEDVSSARAECDEALRLLSRAGLVWRYGPGVLSGDRPERSRLERELTILCEKGISAYFLIVWDFVNWGRENGVPALARGSGVGTMAGYVLGLSNACPVRYGLLFERFTDPDRSEYPDIDIDLCQDGRGRVIEYVRRKYGHVAQIITFGTLKARAAIRDVARALEVPLSEADRVAKLVPEQLHITLDEALSAEPELRKLYDEDGRIRRVIDHARTLEGQARHASVHAAGVIVATRPLQEVVPLYRPPNTEDVVTQWDGPTCERMGLLKMDFLGLRTISVIERCKRLIRETLPEPAVWAAVGRRPGDGGAHPLDLDRLGRDDARVFELFQRGETTGVFQFESGGMRRLLVEMKPDRLEDLIAGNALFRPGPMDLIPDYTRRKHGQDSAPRVHEIVDRHTAETYGVMVYQEQVMQIVHELGGVTLRDAYSLIKAISKKNHGKIEKERVRFVSGAEGRGLGRAQAEELFDLVVKFAGYGFNKSHSTGYAIVAYQTAYLKTYFPNQYMAAFLTYESAAQKASAWIPYLEDCKTTRFVDGRVGVEVRPPDVNLSRADFTVVFDEGEPRDALHGHVRFGLKAIKGAGERAIRSIVEERDAGGAYVSLLDFCERSLSRSSGTINKATIEALVKSGSFDSLHGRAARASMCASIERAMSSAQKATADRAAGQGALFGPADGEPPSPALAAKVAEWTEKETLEHERGVLGFYVSSHPLEPWEAWMRALSCVPTGSVRERPAKDRVVLGGLVQSVRATVVKNGRSAGQKMGVVTLEDRSGTIEVVLFTEAFARYGHLASPDSLLFVIGVVDLSRGEPQVIADRLLPIDALPREPIRWVDVLFDAATHNGASVSMMEHAASVLADAAGPGTPLRVFVQVSGADRPVPIPMGAGWSVHPTPELIRELEGVVGEGCLRLTGPLLPREDEPRERWSVRVKVMAG
jgi:DNA polymerase-3 subunit alpha